MFFSENSSFTLKQLFTFYDTQVKQLFDLKICKKHLQLDPTEALEGVLIIYHKYA